MHWTSRERDELAKRLDLQDAKLDQIHKDIRDLPAKMNGGR
jgi:hypothetical protein